MGVTPEVERSERRAGRRSLQHRNRIVLVAVGLLFIVLLVWWLASCSSEESAGGALTGTAEGPVSGPVTPGTPVAVGVLELDNGGGSAIVIDSVSFVDPTTGLRIVGMYAQPAGESSLGFGGDFKWPRGAAEVDGLTLEPDAESGYKLVLGVQVDAQGIFRSPGIRIGYHSGTTAAEKTFAIAMTFCAPPRLYRARCV